MPSLTDSPVVESGSLLILSKAIFIRLPIFMWTTNIVIVSGHLPEFLVPPQRYRDSNILLYLTRHDILYATSMTATKW